MEIFDLRQGGQVVDHIVILFDSEIDLPRQKIGFKINIVCFDHREHPCHIQKPQGITHIPPGPDVESGVLVEQIAQLKVAVSIVLPFLFQKLFQFGCFFQLLIQCDLDGEDAEFLFRSLCRLVGA